MMAANSATRPSLSQSSGNRISGSRHPKASTLMIASRTQASPSPTGMAAMKLTSHNARVRRTSSIARSRRRSPSAQTGASCGNRSERKLARKHGKTRHREREHITRAGDGKRLFEDCSRLPFQRGLVDNIGFGQAELSHEALSEARNLLWLHAKAVSQLFHVRVVLDEGIKTNDDFAPRIAIVGKHPGDAGFPATWHFYLCAGRRLA